MENTTPAVSFLNLFLNEINHQDVQGLLNTQQNLLEQLDKTNEKLDGINRLSAKRYLDATRDFSNHTQLLKTMKNDLDLIFKRIKVLKMRLNKKYPEAYNTVIRMNAQQGSSLDDDDAENDEIEGSISSQKQITGPMMVKSKTIDATSLSSSSSIRESQTYAQLSTTTKSENNS